MQTKKYAVIQYGFTIWGEGDTVDEAIANANSFLDDDVDADSLIDRTRGREYQMNVGDLAITDDPNLIEAHWESLAPPGDDYRLDDEGNPVGVYTRERLEL